jgi:hypothetical protein
MGVDCRPFKPAAEKESWKSPGPLLWKKKLIYWIGNGNPGEFKG